MANINKRMKQNAANNRLAKAEEIELEKKAQQKKKNQHSVKYMVKAAVIAAMYTGLTFAFYGISFEAVQFRISEILVALVFFEPAAFPGLCVGCMISNLLGPGGIYDAVLGTIATAVGIYVLKWFCSRNGKASIGLLLYAFFNSFLVAVELCYVLAGTGSSEEGVLICFAWVMLGEVVTAVIGGSALYFILKKRWKDIVGETKKSEEQEFTPTTLQ